jgi:hypothetical protein
MQIIGVNIVLSGDNAVVIALAARELPARQQNAAVERGGSAGTRAVVARRSNDRPHSHAAICPSIVLTNSLTRASTLSRGRGRRCACRR